MSEWQSGPRNVRVSEGLFEALADRVVWGKPDAEGFYTPVLYSDYTPTWRTKVRRWIATRLLGLPKRWP